LPLLHSKAAATQCNAVSQSRGPYPELAASALCVASQPPNPVDVPDSGAREEGRGRALCTRTGRRTLGARTGLFAVLATGVGL
jgi:hypothetical protein